MTGTKELLGRIRAMDRPDPAAFASADFKAPNPVLYMNGLLAERGMEKRDAIRRLGLDRTYGYQIFNGTRKPTRTMLIRLAALLGLDLAGTDRLLQIAGRPALYPRRPEDAAVIYAVERGYTLEQLDELLERL